MSQQRLELTWIGKGKEPRLEPRILIEDPDKSFGDSKEENMLIYGDNLLALKALEQRFAGKVKCVAIDPPYNTGNAFSHYEDGVEHSLWLSLMSSRLKVLKNLLSEDGSIWVALDDNEAHYCKVMMDEIFGRNNFIGTVIWQHSIQGKNDSKTFSLHHNYLLVYQKSDKFQIKRVEREAKHNKAYSNPDNDPKGAWRSGDVRSPNLRENLKFKIKTPSGKIIEPPDKGWRWSEAKVKEKIKTGEIIFSQDETRIIRKIYLDEQEGRVAETIWFGEEVGTTREANTEIKSLDTVDLFPTPKPERLMQRIINLSTNEADWVLDSFLGSGTTAAVAHKMNRKWIGIELGEHATTHCLPRLRQVVDGSDKGGISEVVGWEGGGGFRFYELAPSLLKEDSYGNFVIDTEYNPIMLAAAMCKHESFRFHPDETCYWKQGRSTEKDYIFTTTSFLTVEALDKIHEEMLPDESLLICCKSFQEACESRYANVTVKKIPQMLLGKCEFGKEDYSLNIVNLPKENEEEAAPIQRAPKKSATTPSPKPTKTKGQGGEQLSII